MVQVQVQALLGDGLLGSAPSPAGRLRQLLIADRITAPVAIRRMGWKVTLPDGRVRYTGGDREAAAAIAKASGGEVRETKRGKAGGRSGDAGKSRSARRGEVIDVKAGPTRSSAREVLAAVPGLGAGWMPAILTAERRLTKRPPRQVLKDLRPWLDADDPLAKLRDTLQKYEDQHADKSKLPSKLPPHVLKAAKVLAHRLAIAVDKYSERAVDIGGAAATIANTSWSLVELAGAAAGFSALMGLSKGTGALIIAGVAIPSMPLWVPILGMTLGLIGLVGGTAGTIFANWAESTARKHKRGVAELRERYLI